MGFGLGWGLANLGYGWGSYGWGGYPLGTTYAYQPTVPYSYSAVVEQPSSNIAAPVTTSDSADSPSAPNGDDFAAAGESLFKGGDYKGAARAWRHALVDDSNNGGIMLLLSQALFAQGAFDEAAGTLEQALQIVPVDQWGMVVKNYTDLYSNIGDYSEQLKALEKARTAKPDDPGLRFLLGYHYGYLGYPEHAVREIDAGLKKIPKDDMATRLRAQFAKAPPKSAPSPQP